MTSTQPSERLLANSADRPIRCTVAIPVHNRKDLLPGVIASALQSNVERLEVLVVDDCSDDGAWEYLQSLSDSRIRVVQNARNLGLFANFNRCLTLARGEYVRILCNDDKLMPGKLARECAFMDEHPEVTILSSAAAIVREDGQEVCLTGVDLAEGIYTREEAENALFWMMTRYRDPLSCPSAVLVRTEHVLNRALFDTSMRLCGDWDFFLRALDPGALAVNHEVVAKVLLHGGSAGYQLRRSIVPYSEMIRALNNVCTRRDKTWMTGIQNEIAGSCFVFGAYLVLTGYFRLALEHLRLALSLSANLGALTRTSAGILWCRVLERCLHIPPRYPARHARSVDGPGSAVHA